MSKTIIEQLKAITETIEDLIEKETTTWYPVVLELNTMMDYE